MSKRRSFPRTKDFYNNSPLEKLEKLVHDMPQSEKHVTTMHPETEGDTQEGIVDNITMSKKNYKRKFNAQIELDRNSTKASKPNSELVLNVDQTQQWAELQSEVEVQNEVSGHPDTQDIAHQLFQHWQRHLNFHEDIHKTKNGAFIVKTINELANMAGKATPYQQEEI